jgi:predicted GNAT superfamily acetyltransferase
MTHDGMDKPKRMGMPAISVEFFEHTSGVLALNKEWEHFTSPLTTETLAALCTSADYCRVAVQGDSVVAFLIALREGRPYASPNYQWFEQYYGRSGGLIAATRSDEQVSRQPDMDSCEQSDRESFEQSMRCLDELSGSRSDNPAVDSPSFVYIDSLIVVRPYKGSGIGRAVFLDAFRFARDQGIRRVVCEIDIDPPNEVSRCFHDRLGFIEVGRQWLNGGNKQVSLREKRLS